MLPLSRGLQDPLVQREQLQPLVAQQDLADHPAQPARRPLLADHPGLLALADHPVPPRPSPGHQALVVRVGQAERQAQPPPSQALQVHQELQVRLLQYQVLRDLRVLVVQLVQLLPYPVPLVLVGHQALVGQPERLLLSQAPAGLAAPRVQHRQ